MDRRRFLGLFAAAPMAAAAAPVVAASTSNCPSNVEVFPPEFLQMLKRHNQWILTRYRQRLLTQSVGDPCRKRLEATPGAVSDAAFHSTESRRPDPESGSEAPEETARWCRATAGKGGCDERGEGPEPRGIAPCFRPRALREGGVMEANAWPTGPASAAATVAEFEPGALRLLGAFETSSLWEADHRTRLETIRSIRREMLSRFPAPELFAALLRRFPFPGRFREKGLGPSHPRFGGRR